MMLAPPAIQRGELKVARDQLQEAIALADSLDAWALVETFGQNQQVTPRGFLAGVMSLLDAEARPQPLIEEAFRRARRVLNPIDEAFALFFGAFCAVIQEDAELAQRRAAEARTC